MTGHEDKTRRPADATVREGELTGRNDKTELVNVSVVVGGERKNLKKKLNERASERNNEGELRLARPLFFARP